MSTPAEPRFRVRPAPDGEEVAIASVEDLQEMVELGEIPPHWELFDSSIGQWGLARDVAVYRFLVEEIAAAGPLPDVLRGALGPGEAQESTAPDPAPDSPDSPGDPFDLKLDLVDADALPRAPDPEDAEHVEGFEGQDHLDSTWHPPFGSETAPPPAGFKPDRKGRAPDPVEPPPEERAESEESEETDRWFTPAAEGGIVPPEGGSEGLAEPADVPETWQPEEGEAVRPRPRRRLERGLPVRPGLVAGLVLVVGAGAGLLLLCDRQPDGSEGMGTVAAPTLAPPLVRPIPPGIEEAGRLALANVRATFLLVGDSIRESNGLEPSPPGAWLSGGYLANATDYPEVPAFWEGYLNFVGELGRRDREIYFTAIEHGMDEAEVSGAQRDDLLEYFDERYERRESYRQARYAHLADAAEAALTLHAVLVRHENEIVHSPALGGGVSADPILEAVIPAGPIRREVDQALDRVFQALDRSRGGGTPLVEGMRAELFGGFGDPD